MSVVNKDTLKEYFELDDMPTEQQFVNLIDSLLHKLEGVSWEHLTPALQAIINNIRNPNRHWQAGGNYVIASDAYAVMPNDFVLDNVGFTIQKSSSKNILLFGKTFEKKGVLQVANDVLFQDCDAVIDGDMYVGGILYLQGDSLVTGTGTIY